MYGLVNRSIADWVTKHYGGDAWTAIRSNADPVPLFFSTFEQYPDEMTYRIAQATSEQINLPIETVLERLGEAWILYAESEGMADFLSILGRNFVGCLQRMDEMHERVRLMMPNLAPPAFRCEILDDRRLLVKYWSSREGLRPFVAGLLHGLAAWCSQEITIDQVTQRATVSDCDVFHVTLTGN